MKYYFAPSLMCMNLMELPKQMEILNSRADFYHVDIMDGHYVKNITLSPMFIEQIKSSAKLPIDAHLMVEHPNDFIDMLSNAGADYISPHAETINKDAFRTITRIREKGCKVGIVINPATPLSYINEYVGLIDKLTIMTVDCGFAGQKFIDGMLNKIKEAKALKERNGYKYLIEVDGSCNQGTFSKLAEAGTDVFIVGSSGLFGLDSDLVKAWDKMILNFKKSVPSANE
jgi:D-allulose-6-phosphate 3-epimerase